MVMFHCAIHFLLYLVTNKCNHSCNIQFTYFYHKQHAILVLMCMQCIALKIVCQMCWNGSTVHKHIFAFYGINLSQEGLRSTKNENLLKICSPSVHPRCRLVWLALHHLLTNGSTAVNGCRQNESPNSW